MVYAFRGSRLWLESCCFARYTSLRPIPDAGAVTSWALKLAQQDKEKLYDNPRVTNTIG